MARVTAAAGSVASAIKRRRSGEAEGHNGAATATESWTCECGAEYRIAGAGRHRVVWPAGAPEGEPVLGDRCPSCDRPLTVG